MPSLLEALERKYCASCDFESYDNDNEKLTIGGGIGGNGAAAVSIYVPKLPPLACVPELLVLNDCDIDCAGDFDAIKEKCQRVRELDLAQNKLSDWTEVFCILEHMPRIEFLNLSKNQLMGPLSAAHCTSPAISNLKSIVLNGTYLDWLCVNVLLENLPRLEELHLSLNNYKDVLIDAAQFTSAQQNNDCQPEEEETSMDSTTEIACANNNATAATNTADSATNCKQIAAHTALKTLHFTGNPIERWCQICRLGRVFPNLQNLVLAECPIKSIEAVPMPHDPSYINCQQSTTSCTADMPLEHSCNTHQSSHVTQPPYRYFSNLVFLNLSCANINTWDDIDRLARFPRLQHLRVKKWPLWERLESTEHERRQLLIARLPNVSTLNGGGKISAEEREDAERAFIRYYMEKPENERPSRYNELIAKHGKLDPLVNVDLRPEKRVKVVLTHGEHSETRLVDVHRTVADLKVRLEKILGLPANKMRLYYVDQDYKEFGPEEMKYPSKRLYSYNIRSGDEIIVDQKK